MGPTTGADDGDVKRRNNKNQNFFNYSEKVRLGLNMVGYALAESMTCGTAVLNNLSFPIKFVSCHQTAILANERNPEFIHSFSYTKIDFGFENG